MTTLLATRLKRLISPDLHPQGATLTTILAGKSGVASSGFPFIAAKSFKLFLDQVPHLFKDGGTLLRWLAQAERAVGAAKTLSDAETAAVGRVVTVLRTVAYSAAVCAPPDLWLLRHVLGAHRQNGTLAWLTAGRTIECFAYGRAHGLDPAQLRFDFDFLRSRGYLQIRRGGFVLARQARAHAALAHADAVPVGLEGDLTPPLMAMLAGEHPAESELVERLYATPLPRSRDQGHGKPLPSSPLWVADLAEIDIGFRLVPLVLALRALNLAKALTLGTDARAVFAATRAAPKMLHFLAQAGLVAATGKVTELGARVFARGPGPFGIIHAYHSYMTHLPELLRGGAPRAWVARGANVAASQDANRKTFELANASLDRFCQTYGFAYHVFIEHAVGRGEATRQRFAACGESSIRYFGADLEDAAIDKALEVQRAGELPRNMTFVRSADIGEPSTLLAALAAAGVSARDGVMLVGNGFHEIRRQTNERMIAVLRGYQEAGLVLVFTEESALSDEDLLATAWNTYHAGFRYVHELSGQGLRPAVDRSDAAGRYSWKMCATQAGYLVLREFTTRTRTIYPVPRRDGTNPSISVNYFCVPAALGARLGLERAAVL